MWGIKLAYTHRISWEVHNGPIPKGMCVLHKCDNPPCLNPEHLFLGTKKDNSQDMARKGRCSLSRAEIRSDNRGEANGIAKLTAKKVAAIRAEHAAGSLQKHLAVKYGVSRANVCLIVNNKAWVK